MRLQIYTDGTVGYWDYDDTGKTLVAEEDEGQKREEFLEDNGLTLAPYEYGFDSWHDEVLLMGDEEQRNPLIVMGYGWDRLMDLESQSRRILILGKVDIVELENLYDELVRRGEIQQGQFRHHDSVLIAGFDRKDLAAAFFDQSVSGGQNFDEAETAEKKRRYLYLRRVLEKGASDRSYFVRYEAARLGFGLGVLINDENFWVARHAAERVEQYGGLAVWREKHPALALDVEYAIKGD